MVDTPGRIIDHLERGTLERSKIKYLVIDEADKMFNMGFIEQIETIIIKWEKMDLYGNPGIRSGDILIILKQEDDYIAPVWPEQPGEQQKQMF